MEQGQFLSRVAFSVFGLDVYWYGIIIASAIILDFVLAYLFVKHRGIEGNKKTDIVFEMLIAAVLPAVIFARLFFVLFEEGMSITDYFQFRDGGLSILGAVFGGAVGLLVLGLIRKKNFFEFSDIVAPLVILGQAIGRWGNFVNQEVYGAEVISKSWQWFPYAVQIEEQGGRWFQALFFYESMLSLIGFAILVVILFKFRKRGLATGVYLVYYGVVRAILENMRDAQYILKIGGAPASFILSFIMIAAGLGIVAWVVVREIKNKKKKSVEVDLQKAN